MTEDVVRHPKHYAHPSGIEVIEITRYESFLRGNIIKYVLRAPYKGTELQDLQKAAQYLEWEIERVKRGVEEQDICNEYDTDDTGIIDLNGVVEEDG